MSRKLLDDLPDVEEFRRLMQSFAALDAMLSPESEYRYYSFDSAWGDNDMMASMSDGSGDHWFAIFTSHGVALHGLAHESPVFEPGMPKPWVFDSLPEGFRSCLMQEPAFDTANSTYCAWRQADSPRWERGDVPRDHDDGLVEHLEILVRGPEGYLQWAAEYHEVDLRLADVKAVFAHESITQDLATRINPELDFDVLREDLRSIGYP